MILDAAIELLLEGGASEVTAKRIAEETGVARTTTYRQWPDQRSLLLATIDAMVAPHGDPPNTGDLEADLTTALTQLRTRLVQHPVHAVVAALIDHAQHEEAFVAAQRRFLEGLVSQAVSVLEYAQERRELPANMDCAVVAAMVAGPLFYQHLLVHQVIADDMIEQIVSQFMQVHAAT